MNKEVEQWQHEYEVLDACCELAQGKIAELKQDIEAYKRSEQEASEIIAELKAENEKLKKELKNNKLEYQLELNTYNVECGNLLEENKELAHYLADMTERRNKANTCLQEIKAIAENAYCLTNYTNKDMANFAKQILATITKAEEE